MPPEVISLIQQGGTEAMLLLALGWMAKQWYNERESAKSERDKRNAEALTAANALTEQRILNNDAKHQIEMRDFRLQDIQVDLEECRRERERLRFPNHPSGGNSP